MGYSVKNEDYQRIATAIEFIRTNVDKQPSLSDIAAQVHLSEFHFQRLFCRWAGVTPKRYLQALTLAHAKKLLDEHKLSTLNTSFELGLSSGSRLYDHFVQIEAVTPSQYRLKGQGLEIKFAYHDSPFGQVFIAVTTRGICQLDFVEPTNTDAPLKALRQSWGNATIVQDSAESAKIVSALFSGGNVGASPLSLWVRGTNFQLNVWRALLTLRQGQLASYGDIAQSIGKPKASRAVGTAIGANPIALIIPCHRVLRQNAALGGYRWGETRKQAILARELAQGQ